MPSHRESWRSGAKPTRSSARFAMPALSPTRWPVVGRRSLASTGAMASGWSTRSATAWTCIPTGVGRSSGCTCRWARAWRRVEFCCRCQRGRPRCSLVAEQPLTSYLLALGCTPMEAGSTQTRMADYLRDHRDKVIGRWTELVVAGSRGRTSAQEVRRELEELYSLIVRVMSGADDHVAGELRAALDELSRGRARDGYTPRETALGVFTLKEAVYELVADAAELVPEFLSFSHLLDDLGLRTFEAYSAAREQIIADQATAMLELSTP